VEAAATGLAGATGAVKAIAELERDSIPLTNKDRATMRLLLTLIKRR